VADACIAAITRSSALRAADAIYTLRDGRICRAEEYFDRAAALRAAGLTEEAS